MYFVPCQPVVIYSEFGENYIYLNFEKKKRIEFLSLRMSSVPV